MKKYLLLLLTLTVATTSSAQVNFNLGAGAGLFIAENEELYGDLKVDLYPEINAYFDIHGLRFGLSTGFIYRKTTITIRRGSFTSSESSTLSFLPVHAEVGLLPMDFANPGSVISPYIKTGFGLFIPTGDNSNSYLSLLVKAGAEARLDILSFYADISYLYAADDDFSDTVNWGGFVFAGGMRLRIGG